MFLSRLFRGICNGFLKCIKPRRVMTLPMRQMTCPACKSGLKEVLTTRICKIRQEMADLRERQGTSVVDEVTVCKLFGGLQQTTGILCETSEVNPEKGLIVHGMPLKDVIDKLPKIGKQPMPEGFFWYLLTGDLPTFDDARRLSEEWSQRAKLGNQQLIIDNIKFFSQTLHPLAQLACVFCGLSEFSKATAAYKQHACKNSDWELVYEDCMDVIALAPVVAARIYNCQSNKWGNEFDDTLDWTSNYVRMLGLPGKELERFMRLLLTVQADHACGNPATHSSLIASSTLTNPYLAYASGVIAMTGPKYATASQMYAEWLAKVLRCVGYKPCDENLTAFLNKHTEDGLDIPGFEHAVLKQYDPRYELLSDYAINNKICHKWLQFAQEINCKVPAILREKSSCSDFVFPTVHVLSGPLMHVYDMNETSYYPVVFAMARSLGICAQIIIARALELPVEYLNSISTASFNRTQICHTTNS